MEEKMFYLGLSILLAIVCFLLTGRDSRNQDFNLIRFGLGMVICFIAGLSFLGLAYFGWEPKASFDFTRGFSTAVLGGFISVTAGVVGFFLGLGQEIERNS